MLRTGCRVYGKPEGEGGVDYEDGRVEEEDVEGDQIFLPDALGGPRAVVVISDDADIAIDTVEGLQRYVESALPAETMLSPCLRCPTESPLFFLAEGVRYSWIAQSDH